MICICTINSAQVYYFCGGKRGLWLIYTLLLFIHRVYSQNNNETNVLKLGTGGSYVTFMMYDYIRWIHSCGKNIRSAGKEMELRQKLVFCVMKNIGDLMRSDRVELAKYDLVWSRLKMLAVECLDFNCSIILLNINMNFYIDKNINISE